eukprot:Sspe_Gene.76965::Locus_48068_Transcript_1_1_Confidence_1.000_Length_702::g.76965::m.76965/K03734/apbE; FAD:protein FMN transferase
MDGVTSPTMAMAASLKARPETHRAVTQPVTDRGGDCLVVTGVRMEIPFKVKVKGGEEDREGVERLLDEVFTLVDATFTPERFNADSEVAKINNLLPGEPFDVSPAMAEVLEGVNRMHKATGGRFDPTVDSVLRAWEGALKNAETCTPFAPDELELLQRKVGWGRVLKFTNGKLAKVRSSTIDLSGIAKGWAVDKLVERLEQSGHQHIYVDWGGDVRCVGKHPKGREW